VCVFGDPIFIFIAAFLGSDFEQYYYRECSDCFRVVGRLFGTYWTFILDSQSRILDDQWTVENTSSKDGIMFDGFECVPWGDLYFLSDHYPSFFKKLYFLGFF